MSDFLRRYLSGSGMTVPGLLQSGSHPRRHSVPVITRRALLHLMYTLVFQPHRVEGPKLGSRPVCRRCQLSEPGWLPGIEA
jgi:hypothetical protein